MRKLTTIMMGMAVILCLTSFSQAATANTWTNFSNVALDKQWSITFNRSIDPSSIANNVYITQGSTKMEVTASVSQNTLTIKPTSNLAYNTAYTLVVSPLIRDTTGNPMNKTISIPFLTVDTPKQEAYKSFQSEYDMLWNMANEDYENFHLVGYAHDEEVGGYETRAGQSVFGINIGDSQSVVERKYGKPLDSIKKGNTNYTQNYTDKSGNILSNTYKIGQYYVTFFYDIFKHNTVRSVTWVAAETEASKTGFFRTDMSSAYRDSMEEMMVHLINQARVAEGLNPLIYTPDYNAIGRDHSADMVQHQYFSHTNLDGESAKERMDAGGLAFSWYGENLAYGQYSAIYAHEALMNSAGHRENILRPHFTHVLVGVAFTNKGAPYFTINFYRQ
ncbi:Ig-like domain-containing protein [Lysinibacillus sp. KU-BSD001]|uniref:CAP-associated domain-containing protein n=1 Tax=Lysinibacillus sp. KU-BSD001 TaxID=3141328 RepID=UPI0036E7E616